MLFIIIIIIIDWCALDLSLGSFISLYSVDSFVIRNCDNHLGGFHFSLLIFFLHAVKNQKQKKIFPIISGSFSKHQKLLGIDGRKLFGVMWVYALIAFFNCIWFHVKFNDHFSNHASLFNFTIFSFTGGHSSAGSIESNPTSRRK